MLGKKYREKNSDFQHQVASAIAREVHGAIAIEHLDLDARRNSRGMQYLALIHGNADTSPTRGDWSSFIQLAKHSGMFPRR